MENNKIYKIIDKYDVISFDIFDTLIKRNLDNYKEIYEIVEREYNFRNSDLKIAEFSNYRMMIEKKITADDYIPNLKDIYKAMDKYEKKVKEKLLLLEEEIENKYCQCNFDIKPIYDYCLKNNKKIIITSDMYFEKKSLIKLLSKVGYSGYSNIYVSCEYNVSKRNGKLYDFIIQDLKINPSKILHIGDSKISDYLMAKKHRINAYLISKNTKKTKFLKSNQENNIDFDVLYSFVNNNISSKDDFYNFGFEVFGPVLYTYTVWLKNKLRENDIYNIYFLAREGNLLKQAFDIINKDSKFNSHYLYCSRRSTRVPILDEINNIDDIFRIVKMRRLIDIESFMINVGLDIKNYTNLLNKYNLKGYMDINNKNFISFFNDIKKDIRNNALIEKKLLINYLKQELFEGKVAVCDVGWTGTMQSSLNQICFENNINVDILGFYLGLSPEYKKNSVSNKMHDFMFNDTHYEYLNIASFLNLFESLFLAQHGTTIKYIKDNNIIKPVLGKYEYNENETKKFINIQKGALDFVKTFKYNINKETALYRMFDFGMNPTLKNIRMFKTMQYVETKKFDFVNSKSILYYIFHPKKMYIDFCNCSWKTGFLKNVFKFKINYYKVYEILKNNI